jgi:hypothetical protein
MKADTFAGRMSEMRDSPWLSSEDLEDPDGGGYIEAEMTISGVLEIRDAQFKGGRTKAKGHAIKFQGNERMLYLNGVNREKLKEMFGRTAPDMVGKSIVLYVDPRVKLMGKVVPGIRIKASEKAPKKAPPKPVELSPEDASLVAEYKAEIELAADMKTLTGMGDLLREKSKAVQDSLRPVYKAKHAELKEPEA